MTPGSLRNHTEKCPRKEVGGWNVPQKSVYSTISDVKEPFVQNFLPEAPE